MCLALLAAEARAAPPALTPARREALLGQLDAARKSLRALKPPPGPAGQAARHALTAEQWRLRALVRSRRTACDPAPEVRRLTRELAAVAAGKLPHQAPGLHRLAYRSPLDGRLHGFALYVPPGYPGSPPRRFPLVVMLHGMGAGPMKALGRLFGVPDDQLGPPQITCDRPALPAQKALVVAPGGFGDSLYRTAGALDVQAVRERVTRLYRVDKRRITITGLSMGGTGAVELALQRPGVYAGVLALCGYYDRRLDSSTRGLSLLPWERHLRSLHSPVEWAENGRGLPLTLIHGQRDGPARARALQRRYEQLGYKVRLELYPTGHEVWVPGYRGGRAFSILGRQRLGGQPRVVRFRSGRPRLGRAHWVTIVRFLDHGRWAEVQARVTGKTGVELRTDNVAALRLDLPAAFLARGQELTLTADGQPLTLPADRARRVRRVDLRRQAGAWSLGPPPELPALAKRPGLSGPIEDIYHDPLLVVYGTGGGQTRLLRAVARRLRTLRRRTSLRYTLLPDSRYDPRKHPGHSLILVGTEQTNSVLARLGPRLPIRVTADGARVGPRQHRGANLGATFVYPNPELPGRYLRVVAGTSELAYKLLRRLPRYLPDYVVYDEAVDKKPHAPVLGAHRKLLQAGSFDERWRLPPAAPASQPAK